MLQNSLDAQGFTYLLSLFTGVEILYVLAFITYWRVQESCIDSRFSECMFTWSILLRRCFPDELPEQKTEFLMDKLENIFCELSCNTYIQADNMDAISQTSAIHPGGVLLRVYTLSQCAEKQRRMCESWTVSNIMLVSSRCAIKMMRVKQMAFRPVSLP